MAYSQGDIVEFHLGPSKGHEPTGWRPALVVSADLFNRATSMTIVCPITTRDSGFPLHVALPESAETRGFVILEQVRAFDLEARDYRFKESLEGDEFMKRVKEMLRSFY